MPSEQDLLKIIGIQTEIAGLGRNLGEIMSLVVERTLPLVRADGAAIELAEDGEMVYRATAGTAREHLGLRLKREASLSGLCVTTGEPLRCDDTECDPRADREACRKVGIRSMIVIPLRHKESIVGVLKAMASEVAHFSERDMKTLTLLSGLVAAAMYHCSHDDSDLFYRATHDFLSGLANRALFMDRLRCSLAQRPPYAQSVGILMIDIDDLKAVNDRYGHRAGDALIKEFASRSKACARTTDTVARLGGDEFAMILSPVNFPESIDATINRLQAALETPFLYEGWVFQIKASIGASCFPGDSLDIDRLIDLADQRMYAVKRQRKQERTVNQR